MLTGSVSLGMDQEVNAFDDPKDSKNKKQFEVEDLLKEKCFIYHENNFNWQKLICGHQRPKPQLLKPAFGKI